MDFKAYKMDGLGNDFVIIDQRDSDFELNKSQIKSCLLYTSPSPRD